VFRRSEQRLRETRRVEPPARVNAGRARSVQTPDTEDDIIAAVEREPSRSPHAIARELGLSKALVLNLLHSDELHPYHYSQNQ
jgi:hypothetical protein